MRHALLAICVLSALPLFAQQPPQPSKLQLSVFATNLSYTESRATGSRVHGDLGAALEYRWSRQWALELQVTSVQYTGALVIDQNGGFVIDRIERRAYPLDLLAHYRFDNASRWQPFIGAGVHYLRSPYAGAADTAGVEVDGGVHLMITPSLSLRMDAKQQLLRNDGNLESGVKGSIGFGWKF